MLVRGLHRRRWLIFLGASATGSTATATFPCQRILVFSLRFLLVSNMFACSTAGVVPGHSKHRTDQVPVIAPRCEEAPVTPMYRPDWRCPPIRAHNKEQAWRQEELAAWKSQGPRRRAAQPREEKHPLTSALLSSQPLPGTFPAPFGTLPRSHPSAQTSRHPLDACQQTGRCGPGYSGSCRRQQRAHGMTPVWSAPSGGPVRGRQKQARIAIRTPRTPYEGPRSGGTEHEREWSDYSVQSRTYT